MSAEDQPRPDLNEDADALAADDAPGEGPGCEDAPDDAPDAGDDADDAGDDDIPATRQRPLWVMILIILMALYVMVSLRDDLVYFFADRNPVSLGNAVEYEPVDVAEDSYVSIVGIRHPGRGVKLSAILGDKNVFPFMGTRLVYVETLVETEKKGELGESEFRGRLKRFASMSYFDTFRDFTVQSFGLDVDREAILVITHQKPGEMWYIPLIYGILLVILGINLVLMVRRLIRR